MSPSAAVAAAASEDSEEFSPPLPPPPPLLRSQSVILNEAEREGLKKALESVKANALDYVGRGLSPLSFWFGILNVAFSAFIIGRYPESYWLWQTLKSSGLLSLTFTARRALKQELYLLDFCWVFAFMYNLWGWMVCSLCLYNRLWGYGSTSLWLRSFTSSKQLFLAYWGVANGPLGDACVALGNALVLHDHLQMASLFIHISPPFVTWSLRWAPDDVERLWPGSFGMPLTEADAQAVSFGEIFFPAAGLYLIWWVLYGAWLLLSGRFHSVESTGKDTIYSWTFRTTPFLQKLAGCKTKEQVQKRLPDVWPVLLYLAIHLILCLLAIAASFPLWKNFYLHTLYCIALLLSSSWNGSKRYYKMMTRFYTKRLEMLLDDNLNSSAARRTQGRKND
jgi:hypothetical protein